MNAANRLPMTGKSLYEAGNAAAITTMLAAEVDALADDPRIGDKLRRSAQVAARRLRRLAETMERERAAETHKKRRQRAQGDLFA